MGLDMYLSATRFLSGFSHNKDPQEQHAFKTILTSLGLSPTPNHPTATVSVTIGYWRKANAIHAWFVKHVQDDKDECQTSDVSREQLTTLLETCRRVLILAQTVPGQVSVGEEFKPGESPKKILEEGSFITNEAEIAALLPTTSGFFFGSTTYDNYYLEDVRDTIAILEAALALPPSFDFTYRASW